MTSPAVGDQATAAWADARPPAASGNLTIAAVANSYTTQAITFPPGRFSAAPIVVVSLAGTVGSGVSSLQGLTVDSITTAGCNVGVYRTASTNTQINWIAVQNL